MSDQGGINYRVGESTNAPMPPPNQQHLPGPPHRPFLQQAHQGSPAQPYQFHQVRPVRMPNNFPFPGSSLLPSMYTAAQHRPGQFTALGPQNVHHNPFGTPPPTVVPQHQLGQTLYRGPVHPPSQQSVTPSLLIPASPYSRVPPPPTSYVSSALLETTVNSSNPDPVPSITPLPRDNPPSYLAPISSVYPSNISILSSSNPSDGTKCETHSRASEKETSAHLHNPVTVATVLSPCDSDMEMEDDIGQVDDEGVNHLVVKPEHTPIDDELYLNNQCVSQNKAECKLEVRSCGRVKVAGYFDSEGVHHNEAVKSECSPAIDHESSRTSDGNRIDLQDIIVEKSTALPEKAGLPRHLTVSDGRDSFRRVADYASDENSENVVEGHPQNTYCAPVPLSSASGSDCSKVTGFILGELGGTNNSSKKGLEIHSGSSPSYKAPGSVDFKGAFTVSVTNRDVDNNQHEMQHACEKDAASEDGLQNESAGFDVQSNGKFSKEHKEMGGSMKISSDQPKVDEFGRLVREAASDTDSDDSRYARKKRRTRRRNQSHIRSRSRSISPIHRRRRRSPYLQGRRDRRARSRSLSPRYRRSRSRSPRSSRSRSPRNLRSRSSRFRRTNDLGGESKRWVKKRIPECFDFRRGKCYRGTSCRFLHDASNRNEDWRKRGLEKQHSLVSHGSKSNVDEEIKHVSDEVGVHGAAEVKNPGMTAHSHLSAKREDSDGALLQGVRVDCGIPNSNLQTTGYGPQTGNQKLLWQTAFSCENLQETKDFPSKSDNSSISVSSPHKTLASPSNDRPTSITYPSIGHFQKHPSIKVSSALSHSKDADGPQIAQPNYAPSFNPSVQSLHPSTLPNQQSYIPTQPKSSLMSDATPLQLPNSTVNSEIATSSRCSHFQHYQLPRRDDYGSQVNSGSYLNQLPAVSQVGGYQQVRHPIMIDQISPPVNVLPTYRMPSQQFRGPDPTVLTGPSAQSFMVSNSYPQGGIHSHTVGLVQELPASRTPTVSVSSMLPVRASNISVYPCTQQQEPNLVLQHSVTNIIQSHENIGICLRNPPLTEPNNSLVVSSSSTYQNPYSSAIQPPTMGMFNSDALRMEKDATYHSFHAVADRQSIMSNIATSVPNSVKDIGQRIHGSDPNQYDPLVDSIEASAKTSRKQDRVQKWEASGDSDAILRFHGPNKQLDAEENRTKDVETVASAISVDSGDADAEVGAVESLSNSIGLENAAGAEIETEAKSPRKSKKSKDSRSVKLFKVALADFVKEVLRPSWRQGNMSKEAFKTIVKKTVDKVSGSMKGRRIPKSHDKIDRYIESSQRKLTKLVMGYVDKYVKV